jgi:hypothetical protein
MGVVTDPPSTDAPATVHAGVDIGEYCRALEAHLCRTNGGHLIRVVGPAFALAADWARRGVPLRVALHGIDRRVARAEARGGTRRPLRLEFCEADVEEAFAQWQRAVGMRAPAAPSADDAPEADSAEVVVSARRPASLPRHIERVIERLSSVRATSRLAPGAGEALDAALVRLGECLTRARSARGDARDAIEDDLKTIDSTLIEAVVAALPTGDHAVVRDQARRELQGLATRMSPDASRDAEARLIRHLVRTQLALPQVARDV